MLITGVNNSADNLYFFLYFFNKTLGVQPNMNELEKALYHAPSLHSPYCVICGKPATNQHHVVFRSQGGEGGATVSVCGFGNASGCHGKLHNRTLHLRFTDRWQYLETDKPTKYQTALAMSGWRDV